MVVDPTVAEQPSLDKAVRIAALHGSSLELYICDVDQDIPESWAGASRAGEYRELRRQQLLRELRDLATPLTGQGLDVATACEWHAPLEQGIGFHALRTLPDLVVKGMHRHTAVPHVGLTRTDWNLIRQIPGPLLLVGSRPWTGVPRIAAAVDGSHPAGYALALDQIIVDEARGLADALGGVVEIYHVLQPVPHLPGVMASPQQQEAADAQARLSVKRLAGRSDVLVRTAAGGVADGLAQLANTHAPDVLVMGTGIHPRRTHAALVQERISCDLLVVKPPGFISPLLVADD